MPISRGPCREFLAEFSNFVDGTLDPGRRALLLAHLDCCEACLRHLKAYRQGIAAYRAANAPVPAWGLYERVMERLGGEGRSLRWGSSRERAVPAGRSRGAMGAALALAALAFLVIVPSAGVDFFGRSGGTDGASTVPDPPTSWASVMPTVLPAMAPAEAEHPVIRPSPPSPSRGNGLPVQEIPEVPRREVRVTHVNDLGTGIRTSLPLRRPPLVVQRATTVLPAAWVADAALRIP